MTAQDTGTGDRARVVLVSGGSNATPEDLERAETVGRLLAEAGAVVLTGGGGGVMEAASRGARRAGGTALAVLPGGDATESSPNRHVSIAVFTGMCDARNAILVRTAGAVIAIGGGWGTLSEIALASKAGRPVILLDTWEMTPPGSFRGDLPLRARSPQEAVRIALSSAGGP